MCSETGGPLAALCLGAVLLTVCASLGTPSTWALNLPGWQDRKGVATSHAGGCSIVLRPPSHSWNTMGLRARLICRCSRVAIAPDSPAARADRHVVFYPTANDRGETPAPISIYRAHAGDPRSCQRGRILDASFSSAALIKRSSLSRPLTYAAVMASPLAVWTEVFAFLNTSRQKTDALLLSWRSSTLGRYLWPDGAPIHLPVLPGGFQFQQGGKPPAVRRINSSGEPSSTLCPASITRTRSASSVPWPDGGHSKHHAAAANHRRMQGGAEGGLAGAIDRSGLVQQQHSCPTPGRG